MPVTTRKQLSNYKNITSTSKTLSQKTYDLDQLKEEALQTTVAGTTEMNIDCNLELEEPFEASSMFDGFQSYQSDIEREEKLDYLSSCLMSPPMSEPCSPIARARSASLAEAVVPSPCDVFNQEASAPTSPVQDEALNILDEIIFGEIEQPTPFNQVESSSQLACGYDLDDLFDYIESETSQSIQYQTASELKAVDFIQSQPESRQMFTQEQNGFCATFTSQESFSAQSAMIQGFDANDQVFVEDLIPEETLNEIESFETSCSSPAHSVESSNSGSASPTYSSNGDEEYLPVSEIKRIKGIGGGRRGRKRKIDSDYGEDIQGAKKQKNAEAAKRYRQKKQDAEKQAFEQLSGVEEQIKKTRERFNEALNRRNLFLEILFEANEKANPNLKMKFPDWVHALIAAKKQ